VTSDHTMLFFVIVAAAAILLQTGILYAFYRVISQLASRVDGIAGRLEAQSSPILETSRVILEDAQPKIAEITSNLAESTALVRSHVANMAEATGEIVDRARQQAARLDEFVSSTVDKLEVTTDMVQHSVLSPIRRINAIVQAVSAGVGFLRANRRAHKAGRGNSAEADEEMFI
jgi:methyl-accepting chemotaxis protein